MASTSPWPPGAQTASIVSGGGGGGGITWTDVTAAEGTLTDTGGQTSSWADSGDWQEIQCAAFSGSRYIPSQSPARLIYPANTVDMSGAVDADGNALKIVRTVIEIDPTSTPPAEFYLYAAWWDGTTSTIVGAGGRYVSSVWYAWATNYFSGGVVAGALPLGSKLFQTWEPMGPWNGTSSASDMQATARAGGRVQRVDRDVGSWNIGTSGLVMYYGNVSGTPTVGTEVIRFKLRYAICEVPAV